MKCINISNNKNLTLDKDYDVVKEEGNYVYVTNDKGIVTRYSKKLFDLPAVEWELDDVKIELLDDILEVIIGKEFFVNEYDLSYQKETSFVSCGIVEIEGMQEILRVCEEICYDILPSLNKSLERREVCEFVFDSIINQLFKGDDGLMKLMSTYVNGNIEATELIEKFGFDAFARLNDVAEVFVESKNPNTLNDIVLWVFK